MAVPLVAASLGPKAHHPCHFGRVTTSEPAPTAVPAVVRLLAVPTTSVMPLGHVDSRGSVRPSLVRTPTVVLAVDTEQQLLRAPPGHDITLVCRARDAELKRLGGFVVGVALNVARALPPQAELGITTRLGNYLLHFGPVGTNDAPRNTKVIVVLDANEEPACVLAIPTVRASG